MQYNPIGKTGVAVSCIAMGGHEYLPSGLSRGFNEDFEKATTPGYLFEGFGGAQRKAVLRKALEYGVNFFDVTQDSEKEALGRNLRELGRLPYDIYIQTRPEGMVYTYDERNRKMADFTLLRNEVLRILALMRRERIEFLNIAFMKDAWVSDPEYLDKMRENILRLKREGLILFACADTFSGEETYLRQIESGAYDVVYINFNFADCQALRKVFPLCREKGIGVIAREAFMKGELFRFAGEVGVTDKTLLAHAAMKWVFAHPEVVSLVYGSGKPHHVEDALALAGRLAMTPEEESLIQAVRQSAGFQAYERAKTAQFLA